jgi:threonylcarbamoyladenosine tRNA methylthiotransferase MtaB
MIVGFPGETDEDFQETAELAKWAGFSKMHIFPFSAREGTAAAKMKDKVQPRRAGVVKKRAEILRKLGEELAFNFRKQFVGQAETVLIEGFKDGQAFGHCERYYMIYLETKVQKLGKNSIVKAKIIKNGDNYMLGIAENLMPVP